MDQSIRMIGQFLHTRQVDREQMASRVTFELEEQTASAVREDELRGEYARAAENLKTELSAEAAQHFFYLERQQNNLHKRDFAQWSLHLVANTHPRRRTCSRSTFVRSDCARVIF